MFRMTSKVSVEIPLKISQNNFGIRKLTSKVFFTANSMKWNINIDNICDSASFVVPAMCVVSDKVAHYTSLKTHTSNIIEVGQKIEISAGYDGHNNLQFKGFISRINYKVPVEIECEGYSYQLNNKIITKSFGKTTVKEVLNYLIKGTDIKLSKKCPDKIAFEGHAFSNVTGIQVLNYLKDKYYLTIFFEYDQLYVGWLATYKAETVKLRLNWNVIKDEELLFQSYTGAIVHIEGASRQPDGHLKKIKSNNVKKPGNMKTVKMVIQSDIDKQLAVYDLQLHENRKGYSGSVLCFVKPFIRPGMTAQIIDKKYIERNGSYFIESVQGTFDTNGARQKVGIGFTLSSNK